MEKTAREIKRARVKNTNRRSAVIEKKILVG